MTNSSEKNLRQYAVESQKGRPLPTALRELNPNTLNAILELPLLSKEWSVNRPCLVISGPSGAGKTVGGEGIGYAYNMEFMSIGAFARDRYRSQTGLEVIGYNDRTQSEDEFIDEVIREKITNAVENKQPTIIEARLGGVIATEMMQEDPSLRKNIVRVLWTANRNERARRVAKRQKISPEQARVSNDEREERNLATWKDLHPILLGNTINDDRQIIRDHYDPETKDENGKPLFYDYAVNTTRLSVARSIREVHEYMKTHGFVDSMTTPPRQPNQIFPA